MFQTHVLQSLIWLLRCLVFREVKVLKYIVLIPDGMSDYPIAELGNRTPLEAARIHNMNTLASEGILGLVQNIPENFPPGSDIAILSIFGYNPERYYSGRAPLEAASRRIPMSEADVAFRCNLVTLEERNGSIFMKDYSSGHISTEEASRLIEDLNRVLGGDEFSFHPGVSYRHLMIWRSGEDSMRTTPPHDITSCDIKNYLPDGKGADVVISLMERSMQILKEHSINKDRIKKGLNPATCIWLWGQGRRPNLSLFGERFGVNGAVISAVDLIKGIGVCAGLHVIDVPGATGYLDTNYEGKAEYALKWLEKGDFILMHIEAPDEAGHEGSWEKKIKAIEDFDRRLLGTLLDGLRKFDGFSILLLPDHPTPVSIKTHVREPVPFLIFRSHEKGFSEFRRFSEDNARKSGIFIENGHMLMELFIRGIRLR